jgi:hypothetical protein
MGFCLLRRDGDTVALIAATLFATRAEALAEISRLSAGEGIDADEVFLLDIDAAMPVLIVPQPPAAEGPEAANEVATPAAEETGETTQTADSTAPASVLAVEAAIAEAVLAGSDAPETDAEEPPPLEEASDEPEVPLEDLPIIEDTAHWGSRRPTPGRRSRSRQRSPSEWACRLSSGPVLPLRLQLRPGVLQRERPVEHERAGRRVGSGRSSRGARTARSRRPAPRRARARRSTPEHGLRVGVEVLEQSRPSAPGYGLA